MPARAGQRRPDRLNQALVLALVGIAGHERDAAQADFVIGAYHRLFQIERSFRMSKHELIFQHTRESIEAHLTVVFAALGSWVSNGFSGAGARRERIGAVRWALRWRSAGKFWWVCFTFAAG